MKYTEEDSLKELVTRLPAEIRELVEKRVELLQLKLVGKASKSVAGLVQRGVIVGLVLIIIIFLGLGTGYFVGDLLGNTAYGFFSVGGFFVLILLFVGVFFRRPMLRRTKSKISRKMLKSLEQDDSDY